ncbi:class I SAM-dependent methyltransferase [Pseudomonas syringae]|uniref:class I SAM-dependent methyltransferase n=1 Tax=Pseudomonas syringae TaxID=317 RepID=UPI0009B0F458|nr:class I SAM-dependent methyltransferase [Pseudomonas syringae]
MVEGYWIGQAIRYRLPIGPALETPGGGICNLGAGGGRHARLFAAANLDVVAMDRNQQALKALENVRSEYANCHVVGDDILSFLTGYESTLDAIVMWDCVHHVVKDERAFDDLARCLRLRIADHGYMLITFLSDISYHDQLSGQERYLLSREAAARQLQAAFNHGWQMVLEKRKASQRPCRRGFARDVDCCWPLQSHTIGSPLRGRSVQQRWRAWRTLMSSTPPLIQACTGLQSCRESH